jgi:hypothetical protein
MKIVGVFGCSGAAVLIGNFILILLNSQANIHMEFT